jgi:hypothetical protein
MTEEEHEIQRLLPSIALRRVANAGHQIPSTNFDGFFAALAEVLASA